MEAETVEQRTAPEWLLAFPLTEHPHFHTVHRFNETLKCYIMSIKINVKFSDDALRYVKNEVVPPGKENMVMSIIYTSDRVINGQSHGPSLVIGFYDKNKTRSGMIYNIGECEFYIQDRTMSIIDGKTISSSNKNGNGSGRNIFSVMCV